MDFFFGSKAKETPEKKVNDAIDRAINSRPANLLASYAELTDYIPEFSHVIVRRAIKNMAQLLGTMSTPPDVQSKIIDILVQVVDNIDSSEHGPETLRALLAEPGIIPALFLHTRHVDARVIRVIDFMFVRDPMKFINFIQGSEESIMPLIQAVSLSQDESAGHLLHKLAMSNPSILQSLLPEIRPQLRKYPATIAIDFMVSSAELLDVIPSDEIESWLLQHNKFTVFDVEQICTTLYPMLWERPITAYLMNRTSPPDQMEHLGWIHDMKPQDFAVSESETGLASRAIVAPFTGNVSQVARNAYVYLRLFVLSLSKAANVDSDAVSVILDLLTDTDEWIAAAALQVVFMWTVENEYLIPSDFVFVLSAAAVRQGRSPALIALYKAMLYALASHHNVAAAIIMSEPKMKFDTKSIPLIVAEKWVFPHFPPYLEKVPALSLINYRDSCRVLGYVMNFLGTTEPVEDHSET